MNRNNQIARNQQVQAARQRLGMIPGGGQQGNLAGCGGGFNGGGPWSPYPVAQNLLPNMAPMIDPQYVAGPNTALVQNLAPLSAVVQAVDAVDPTTIEVSCRQYFYASGISSCNECWQIMVNSILVGGSNYNLLGCGQVDAGIWNTDQCYCPWDIGCISTLSPATIVFTPFGAPSVLPWLGLYLWGTAVMDFRGCGTIPPFGPFPGAGGGGVPWANQPLGGGGNGGGGIYVP